MVRSNLWLHPRTYSIKVSGDWGSRSLMRITMWELLLWPQLEYITLLASPAVYQPSFFHLPSTLNPIDLCHSKDISLHVPCFCFCPTWFIHTPVSHLTHSYSQTKKWTYAAPSARFVNCHLGSGFHRSQQTEITESQQWKERSSRESAFIQAETYLKHMSLCCVFVCVSVLHSHTKWIKCYKYKHEKYR